MFSPLGMPLARIDERHFVTVVTVRHNLDGHTVFPGGIAMQRWLERLYRQRPARYMTVCMIIAMLLIAVFLTPIATAVTSRYEGQSLRGWATSFVAAEPFVFGAMLLAGFLCRREMRI